MAGPDIYWEGESGAKYGYWIHPIETDFKDAPGNYIYAKETEPHRWRPVYIGQTSSLKDRLADHEKEMCAKDNGATHIHAHTASDDESKRLAEEADLIGKWNPVCNA
jgi:predicted GIY-YIG superfamily endonuclease